MAGSRDEHDDLSAVVYTARRHSDPTRVAADGHPDGVTGDELRGIGMGQGSRRGVEQPEPSCGKRRLAPHTAPERVERVAGEHSPRPIMLVAAQRSA